MTAKIKLNAASGGGSISIQAPSSSSNNRVISLPDIADGTLVTSQSTLDATKLSGALPAISGANLTGISSGDFVKLAVATGAGGTGDLVFDNLDVATYKTFDFTLMCQPSTDAQQLRFRYRTGGSSGSTITDAHHQVAYLYMYNSNNIAVNTNMGIDNMLLTQGVGGGNSQEGLSLNMRISMGDSNDNGVTRQRMNTVWWSVMVHNESLMPEWHVGNGTLTEGGGAGGVGSYPTGFVFDFTSGNVGNFSYQLYGLKR
jgi:hypothetical protein